MNFHKSCLAVILFATMIAASSASAASCSNANLSGTYGYLIAGQALYDNWVVPGDAIGQLTFDGNGNLTAATETESFDGTIQGPFAGSGTYSVASNCTGTFTITQDGLVVNFALDHGNNQFQAIFAAAGTIYPGFAATQGNATCGVSAATKIVAVNLLGTINSIGPVSVVGQLALKNGNITGSGTSSLNGTITAGSISGSYTENPDCTGTLQITPPGSTSALNFTSVVVAANRVLLMETDSGATVSGTLQHR